MGSDITGPLGFPTALANIVENVKIEIISLSNFSINFKFIAPLDSRLTLYKYRKYVVCTQMFFISTPPINTALL